MTENASTAVNEAPIANGHRWPCSGFYSGNHIPARDGAWTCACEAAQDGQPHERYEHEWQAAQRATEMAASNGKPAAYWEVDDDE